MDSSLVAWIDAAEALNYFDELAATQQTDALRFVRERADDYYISLVAALFSGMRELQTPPQEWSRLGNAFAQIAAQRRATEPKRSAGDDAPSVLLQSDSELVEPALFAASAYYFGGFSASAYLTLRAIGWQRAEDGYRATYELLARPESVTSESVSRLVSALRDDEPRVFGEELRAARNMEDDALNEGPSAWVGWRLYVQALTRFNESNLRAVLPKRADGFWDPLVSSFLGREPPVWDFFPSQAAVINDGILGSASAAGIQMPTGAGKTALTETIIYDHLRAHSEGVAVLLVPYRALASELRRTVVQRLNLMGFPARAVYGGTVPTAQELHNLAEVRAVVATPEALSGLLTVEPSLLQRLTLLVCDEGHLLDGGSRGIGLEMLLTRIRNMRGDGCRHVFISAVIPNMEEISAWLGGGAHGVFRSEYRPSLSEYGRLDVVGKGNKARIDLRLNPHRQDAALDIQAFLSQREFRYQSVRTRRWNTYSFDSRKTQAVASARKALGMGTVAVFAANKRGQQGCIGLAEELLAQLSEPLPMPRPSEYLGDPAALQNAQGYFDSEFGADWLGSRLLREGAVMHHGDLPQEARDVTEGLLREGVVRMVFCTSTLAEGVNLPIRTLVLYSVQRRQAGGSSANLRSRDIMNLAGRAGRPGASTRGLVVCANAKQWPQVSRAARQVAGERVVGALLELMQRLKRELQSGARILDNTLLEVNPDFHALTDGIDAVLVDLASEEVGDLALTTLARQLAEETYAAQLADAATLDVLREVCELRAARVTDLRPAGRLPWLRESGSKLRLVSSVEEGLLRAPVDWANVGSPVDDALLRAVATWAWSLPEIKAAIAQAPNGRGLELHTFMTVLRGWMEGRSLGEIAALVEWDLDDLMAFHSRVVAHELHVAVEQGVALLRRFLEAEGVSLSRHASDLPEHVRFGVPTAAARVLARVLTHRRAALVLGASEELVGLDGSDVEAVRRGARQIIEDRGGAELGLGALVLEKTADELRVESGGEAEA